MGWRDEQDRGLIAIGSLVLPVDGVIALRGYSAAERSRSSTRFASPTSDALPGRTTFAGMTAGPPLPMPLMRNAGSAVRPWDRTDAWLTGVELSMPLIGLVGPRRKAVPSSFARLTASRTAA